jgi:predicted regulator of Ras-like GTPase activity (Roadblock/LC7/MglB family)
MYTRPMPRMEEVLAELAALPGVRSAALGGFDGLLVDSATRRDALGAGAGGADALGAGAGAAETPLIGTATAVRAVRGAAADADLDGAVVEIAHAWNALQRACLEQLRAGSAREVVLVAEGGVALAHTVGDAWFALLWAEPSIDVAAARTALQGAAALLGEAVA